MSTIQMSEGLRNKMEQREVEHDKIAAIVVQGILNIIIDGPTSSENVLNTVIKYLRIAYHMGIKDAQSNPSTTPPN